MRGAGHRHLDGHAFSSELIDHREHSNRTSVLGPTGNEVICPYVTFSLRFQSDDRTIIQPESPPFWLLLRDLQPFSSPDTFYTFVVHLPSLITEQRSDPAIPVPAEPYCKHDDVSGQRLFIVERLQRSTLRRSVLIEHPAGPAFRYSRQYLLDVFHALSAT